MHILFIIIFYIYFLLFDEKYSSIRVFETLFLYLIEYTTPALPRALYTRSRSEKADFTDLY